MIDSSILYGREHREEVSLLADEGLLLPIWSAHIVSEITRVLLYEKQQQRGRRLLPRTEYERFRSAMNRMVAHVDRRYEIQRVTVEPLDDELHWAALGDPDDLHLQLLARTAGADYVLSENTHDFPNPRSVGEHTRGVLQDVVWIEPQDLFQALRRSAMDLPESGADDRMV